MCMNTPLGMECPQRATPKLCVQAHADMNKGSSNNYGCGMPLHGLYLGSWARAQEGELLLESTFCASQQLQWHWEGQCRELLGMLLIVMLVALARGCQLLCKACLLLVPLDKDWGCLLGDGAGKTDPEAPGPLVLKVDMMLGKAMLRQARLNFGGMCLGSTWKLKLLPLWQKNLSHGRWCWGSGCCRFGEMWNVWQMDKKHCQRHEEEIDEGLRFA